MAPYPQYPVCHHIPENEQIEHFRHKKLTPEMPGILNWMLDGLAEYQSGGLRPPDIVCKATEKYRHDMNSVGGWIERTCERVVDKEAKLFLSAIHEQYAEWAAAEIGWTASKQRLAEELRSHGFQSDSPKNKTRFLNIRLKLDVPEEG